MKTILVLLCVCASVLVAAQTQAPACYMSLANIGVFGDSCAKYLKPNPTIYTQLTDFCDLNTASPANCSLKNLKQLINQAEKNCPMIPADRFGAVSNALAMAQAQCMKSASGHYCVQSALQLADVVQKLPEGKMTIAAATQILQATCDSTCYNGLINMGNRFATIFNDDDLKLLLAASGIACTAVKNGDYCFVKFAQMIAAAQAGNATTIGALICDPCIRKLAPFLPMLKKTDFGTLISQLPDFNTVCQSNANVPCMQTVAALVQSMQLDQCAADPTACAAKFPEFIKQAGCCAKALLPFIPAAFQSVAQNALANVANCAPPKDGNKLKVIINLANINVTRLQALWNTLKDKLAAEFAAMIGVLPTEVVVTVTISPKRAATASLDCLVTPSGTSWTPVALASTIDPTNIQFSTLNAPDAQLALTVDGVSTASGSAAAVNPNGSGAGFASVSIFLMIAALLALLF